MDDQDAQQHTPVEDAKAALTPGPATSPTEPQVAKTLTPEEQMALYEEDLKENDWGHQPC